MFFVFQSVATIGSTLTTVQHDVKTLQAAFENQKKDDDSKKTMVSSSWEYYFTGAKLMESKAKFDFICFLKGCFMLFYLRPWARCLARGCFSH